MKLWPFRIRTVEPHKQLLGSLWLLLQKVRQDGLLAVEGDIESPRTSALFTRIAGYDDPNAVVYDFVCDVIRLLILNHAPDAVAGAPRTTGIRRYMAAYRRSSTLNRVQRSMFEVARLTLLAMIDGQSPTIALEHGRQGVPASRKPSFAALEAFVRDIELSGTASAEELACRLDTFYDSIGAPRGASRDSI